MAEERYLRLATLRPQPTTRVPTTLRDQRHIRGAPTLRLLPAVRREEEGPLLAPSSEYTLLYGASDPLPLSACCAQAHSNAANMARAQLGCPLPRGCMGYGRNEIPTTITTTTTTITTTKTTTTTTTTTATRLSVHTLPPLCAQSHMHEPVQAASSARMAAAAVAGTGAGRAVAVVEEAAPLFAPASTRAATGGDTDTEDADTLGGRPVVRTTAVTTGGSVQQSHEGGVSVGDRSTTENRHNHPV
jgi:hypothetical protein